MTAERVTAIIAQLTPILVAIAAGVWKLSTYIRRDDEGDTPIQQGQVIPAQQADSWAARAAYDGALALLADEQADHARTINRHRTCHERMSEAGLVVPDDH